MTDKIKVDLGPVQRTMFFPLVGRALETRKPHPLLVDTMAVEIMGKIDLDLEKTGAELNPHSMAGWISRSLYIDSVAREFIAKNPDGTVVNIGCGMDTTFERVDNGRIRWIDLDLPDSIALRKLFINETERRKFVASSFLEEGWLGSLPRNLKILFIAAGIFYYFEGKVVKEFLDKLGSIFHDSEMIFDHTSPIGVEGANRVVIRKGGLDESSFLKWGTKASDMPKFLGDKIKILELRPVFKGYKGDLGFKWNLIVKITDALRMSYFIHAKFL